MSVVLMCTIMVSLFCWEEYKLSDEKKKCGLYMRVSTDDQAKERI